MNIIIYGFLRCAYALCKKKTKTKFMWLRSWNIFRTCHENHFYSFSEEISRTSSSSSFFSFPFYFSFVLCKIEKQKIPPLKLIISTKSPFYVTVVVFLFSYFLVFNILISEELTQFYLCEINCNWSAYKLVFTCMWI